MEALVRADADNAALSQVERPVLELNFRYGNHVVAMNDEGDDGPARHHQAERQACRLLERFGVVELEYLAELTACYGSKAHYAVCADDDVHAYCSFGAYALPQLRELGWEVDLAQGYPYLALPDSTPWYARVEGDDESHDWFGLELGIEVNGQRLDMLPALLDVLDQMGGSTLAGLSRLTTRRVALQADTQRYLLVPRDRMQRLLRVVRDLYDANRSGTRMRLHKDDAVVWEELAGLAREDGAPMTCEGVKSLRERASTLSAPITANDFREPPELKATLRDYQRTGVAWLQRLRHLRAGGILADDMGLGKTLQTIAHLLEQRIGQQVCPPALIVAPTTLLSSWQREIARFAPTLRTLLLYGPKRTRRYRRLPTVDVAITSYTVLRRDLERLQQQHFSTVVLDEAQAIKNHRSSAHRAACEINADSRLCLTGTPLENHLGEVHSLFSFLMPGLLGSNAQFTARYRAPIESGDEERMVDLKRRLDPFILRRMKRDVATELPDKTEFVRAVDFGAEQRDLYESIRLAAHSDVRSAIRKKGLAASTLPVLDALTKLRLACCHPRLVKMADAQKVKRSAKLEVMLSLLSQLLCEGRRVLIFSQFTSMLAIISEALLSRGIRHVKLTGATSDRAAKVDAFQGGEADVFLISLKAGGTGLTLTRADTVIHYDPWWNPAAQAQATDRAHRIGQTEAVFVCKLIVAGSVEERMLQLQRRKQSMADSLLSNSAGAGSLLTEETLGELLAPLS